MSSQKHDLLVNVSVSAQAIIGGTCKMPAVKSWNKFASVLFNSIHACVLMVGAAAGSLRGREHAVDFAAMFEIDEFRIRVEPLQCGVLVIAVDRAISDPAIFQILNKVRGEEAFSDAAFAVMMRLICLFIRNCVESEVVEDLRCADRACVNAPVASRCAPVEPEVVRTVALPVSPKRRHVGG